MSTPAVRRPATARDIIREVVRNMHEGLEPLHYTTLPPAIYHVYLHPEDFERLRGIFPRMQAETRQALDAEMADLNRASLGERLKVITILAVFIINSRSGEERSRSRVRLEMSVVSPKTQCPSPPHCRRQRWCRRAPRPCRLLHHGHRGDLLPAHCDRA